MRYAKFIDRNRLEYAPNPIHWNGQDIFTTDPSPYGYKQVITTNPPQEVEGYYWSPYWAEEETQIVQEWEQKENPDIATEEDFKDSLAELGVDMSEE